MPNCNRESIRTLVVLHGQRKAARIAMMESVSLCTPMRN